MCNDSKDKMRNMKRKVIENTQGIFLFIYLLFRFFVYEIFGNELKLMKSFVVALRK